VELEVVNRYLRKVDRYGDKVITQLIELIDPSIYLGNAASITMVLVACLQRSGKLECRSLGRAESAVLIGLDGVLFYWVNFSNSCYPSWFPVIPVKSMTCNCMYVKSTVDTQVYFHQSASSFRM
jgi:hypothetical protein